MSDGDQWVGAPGYADPPSVDIVLTTEAAQAGLGPDVAYFDEEIQFSVYVTNPDPEHETGDVVSSWAVDENGTPLLVAHPSIGPASDAWLSWTSAPLMAAGSHDISMSWGPAQLPTLGTGYKAFNVVRRPDTTPGQYQIKDASGNVLQTSPAKLTRFSAVTEAWTWVLKSDVWAAKEIGKLDGIDMGNLEVSEDLARQLHVTAAFGVQGSWFFEYLGVEAGVGIYTDPQGDLGWYHSLGADLGLGAGLSGTLVCTFVKGGPEDFAGPFLSVTVAGGWLGYAGVTLLYSPTSREFMGAAMQVGLGAGFSIYGTASMTWLHDLPLPFEPDQ